MEATARRNHFARAILFRRTMESGNSEVPIGSHFFAENSMAKRHSNLTKRDLILRISSETKLRESSVQAVVQKMLDHIREAVAQGITVELRNFGIFKVKVQKARIGRNPKSPRENLEVPSRSVVKFKPGKQMREGALSLSPKDLE